MIGLVGCEISQPAIIDRARRLGFQQMQPRSTAIASSLLVGPSRSRPEVFPVAFGNHLHFAVCHLDGGFIVTSRATPS